MPKHTLSVRWQNLLLQVASPMFWREIKIAAVFMVIGGAAYYLISDITRKDIIAANAFARPVEAEPLSAGDIVVLPNERGSISRICNAVVSADVLENVPKSEFYFNRAQRIVAWSAELAEQMGLLEAKKAEDVVRSSGLTFVGSASSLMSNEFTYQNPEDCECLMARSMALGERVCTVSASLIETSEAWVNEGGEAKFRPVERSLAVTLRRHVVYLPQEVFESCGVPFTPEAKLVQQELCDDRTALPPDVRLRKYLNLIESKPFVVTKAMTTK